MKVVIDIPENDYKLACNYPDALIDCYAHYIKNGTLLPEKHGRLIDADVLWDAMSKYNDNEGAKMPFGYDDALIHRDSACFVIENAPTVIEAEGEG